MKKNFIMGIFALALLTTTGYGVQKSMSDNANLNELALANVEALANGENDGWPCQDCSTCTGYYYLCASGYDKFWEDIMRNCRGIDITVTIDPSC